MERIDEFRIVSRSSARERWRFRPFTGSRPSTREEGEARIEKARAESPAGWEFKLEHRVLTIERTRWNAA